MNYFELFNIKPEYAIDKNNLKKLYLQQQVNFHPDRAKSDTEKVEFLDKSMQINSGYKTLMDDYARAEHLLSLSGQEISDQNSKNILTTTDLENIWQQNEELDNAQTMQELFALEKIQLISQEELMQELRASFDANNIQKALELTVKLKYLTNLVKNIRLKIKDANN